MAQRYLPAVTGLQLIELLRRDGWELRGDSRHGAALTKYDHERSQMLWAIVPKRGKPLPKTLLHRILSVKQTGIGRKGLQSLIEKYGLP